MYDIYSIFNLEQLDMRPNKNTEIPKVAKANLVYTA